MLLRAVGVSLTPEGSSGVSRFKNTKGIEVGRIARDDGAWLAKLLDHDLLKVTGYCVACPDKFRSGKSFSSRHRNPPSAAS